jgi:hypothetical protein
VSPEEGNPRRELVTKLLPFVAVSAIRLGVLTSPLGIISSAANRYNETVQKPSEKIDDLLPLLPGIEKLQVEVTSPETVTLTLQREDVSWCAEEYLSKTFSREGARGAISRTLASSGVEAEFDRVLRLPSKNIYLKLAVELPEDEAKRLLEVARKLNPAEVLVVTDRGGGLDVRFDPVFVSENRVLRGRFRTISTTELLAGFFGSRFESRVEFVNDETVRVTLRLL